MRRDFLEAQPGGKRDAFAESQHLAEFHDVAGIARRIADIAPDVIVIDLENPNRDMLENMFQLSRAVKRPRRWQARMRTSTMTGVLDASDISKARPMGSIME